MKEVKNLVKEMYLYLRGIERRYFLSPDNVNCARFNDLVLGG